MAIKHNSLITCSVVIVSYQVARDAEEWPWQSNMLEHRVITTANLLSDY